MIFYSHYKKIRRERKISLEDISRRTKIDIKYLKYLESGKFSEIPKTQFLVKQFETRFEASES